MVNGLLTTTEAGLQLGVKDSRVRQLVLSGRLKGEKVGPNFLLIKQAEVNRFLNARAKKRARRRTAAA